MAEQPSKPRRLITPKELPEKGITYHLNHLRKLWGRGAFPAPIYLSARKFAWPEEAIDRWIDEKIAEQARSARLPHKQ